MTGHVVVTDVDRPADEVVEAFADVPTPVVSDVTTKGRNAMDHDVEPVAGGPGFVGTAVTVDAPPGDNLVVHRALKLARPGDVLVVDADGYSEAGVWGELTSASARTHGLAATVVDGAVRDAAEIDAVGYPVYARAVSPKGSHKRAPGSVNVAVTCGGVTVEPGDVVLGDGDGVAVVGADEAAGVLADAEAKLDDEAELREAVEDGTYIYDAAGLDERFAALDVPER